MCKILTMSDSTACQIRDKQIKRAEAQADSFDMQLCLTVSGRQQKQAQLVGREIKLWSAPEIHPAVLESYAKHIKENGAGPLYGSLVFGLTAFATAIAAMIIGYKILIVSAVSLVGYLGCSYLYGKRCYMYREMFF